MKKILFISFVVFAITIISCSKDPDCIQNKIEDFKTATVCESAKIHKYKYEGNYYYAFNEEVCCCDMQSFWYDEKCNLVCTTGGIAPGINECDIPVDSLEFIETVWEK
ncbi:MAG: hypothetical protein H7Y00_01340 [Fimbriimonadaceae bacterium]|nr:hypothetical protein [Chitinophagales bacterium]